MAIAATALLFGFECQTGNSQVSSDGDSQLILSGTILMAKKRNCHSNDCRFGFPITNNKQASKQASNDILFYASPLLLLLLLLLKPKASSKYINFSLIIARLLLGI